MFTSCSKRTFTLKIALERRFFTREYILPLSGGRPCHGHGKKRIFFLCVINCGPEREMYRDMRYNSHRNEKKIACTLTMISDQNCLITQIKKQQ